jgi:OmpA-OmpF porin, OOP family
MKKILISQIVFTLLTVSACIAIEPDVEGSKDYPLLSRMPNYYISEYVANDFDFHVFALENKEERIEGKKLVISYNIQEGLKSASMLEIVRNYSAALKKVSGQVLYEGDRFIVCRVEKEGKEIWLSVEAYNDGTSYQIVIVEKKAMTQSVVTNPEMLAGDLKSSGHVAVYGIYFDSGKSEIKPESEPVIKAIADLLIADPGLKLFVVGHTDNDGEFEANLKLSEARAAAVGSALTGKHGIDSSRLIARGVGQLCPVVSNDAPEGKAKNRRVELVKF